MSRSAVGTSFVQALSGRNWSSLEGLFDSSIQFRALVPSGLREATGGVEASGHFQQWFGKADALELVDFTVDALLDKLRIAYRLRVAQGSLVPDRAADLLRGD